MKDYLVNRLAKSAVAKYGSVAGFLAALGTEAQAALPAGVETAIAGVGTDLVTAMTAIITAFIAFWGLRVLSKKMGWGGS